MRIAVRVVPRALCEEAYLCIVKNESVSPAPFFSMTCASRALIFPCESFAQAAIEGFMASRHWRDWYLDIQDLDDPEAGSIQPE